MANRVTISLEQHVYDELCRAAGPLEVSDFIASLLKPREAQNRKTWDIEEGYRRMAADVDREAEAVEWMEGTAEAVVDAER